MISIIKRQTARIYIPVSYTHLWHRPGSRGSRFCTGPDAMPPAGKAYAGTKDGTVLPACDFAPAEGTFQSKERRIRRRTGSAVS